MKKASSLPLLPLVFLVFLQPTLGQLSLTSAASGGLIDFETTVDGVTNDVFAANGFQPVPAPGQLDSNAWAVSGFSDGDLPFGGTALSGDLARGTSMGGGTGTGGLYALRSVPPAGVSALCVQPGGSDFTPGTITLRLLNGDTTRAMAALTVTYDILFRNDENRSSSLEFSYSLDNIAFTAIAPAGFASPEAADPTPQFVKEGGAGPSRTVTITGLNIPPGGGELFLRWTSDDVSGSGSRDEIAVDNISVSAQFVPVTAARASIAGRVVTEDGRPVRSVMLILSSQSMAQPAIETTNNFGFFRFPDLAVGEAYVLQAVSGKHSFLVPSQILTLQQDIENIVFTASPTGSRSPFREKPRL